MSALRRESSVSRRYPQTFTPSFTSPVPATAERQVAEMATRIFIVKVQLDDDEADLFNVFASNLVYRFGGSAFDIVDVQEARMSDPYPASWYTPESPGNDYELHKAEAEAAEMKPIQNSSDAVERCAECGVVRRSHDDNHEFVPQVTARIRADMSDLEIVNEILRVVDHERLDIIIDMLEDRVNITDVPVRGIFSFGAQEIMEP